MAGNTLHRRKTSDALWLGARKAEAARRGTDGDSDHAASLLWTWSRQDTALRDALVRIGAHVLARHHHAPQDG